MGKSTFTYTPAQVKMNRIVELLTEEPMIWTEVAAKLHCHKATASRYLWEMARQPSDTKRIYIVRWVEDGKSGRKIPVFKAGNLSNRRKPQRLTPDEVFQRIMSDPVRHAKRREKYRKAWHVRKGQPIPPRPAASPFAALGL